uniref:Uncharacterized protein n=1 Tax=Tetradesmus obliquus TaxID=3088 RepID=A0A383W7Y8_TETOB
MHPRGLLQLCYDTASFAAAAAGAACALGLLGVCETRVRVPSMEWLLWCAVVQRGMPSMLCGVCWLCMAVLKQQRRQQRQQQRQQRQQQQQQQQQQL